MSSPAITMPVAEPAKKRTSLRNSRRWALITSYVFLVIFAIFFLMPPYYMVVTSLKSDAEMARLATNPWFIFDGVTLDQFKFLFTQTDFLIFFSLQLRASGDAQRVRRRIAQGPAVADCAAER